MGTTGKLCIPSPQHGGGMHREAVHPVNSAPGMLGSPQWRGRTSFHMVAREELALSSAGPIKSTLVSTRICVRVDGTHAQLRGV
jgi:hypothetical protein